MLSITELAWLAGILEGEGCFLLTTKSESNLGYPQINVSMSDKDVMDRVALLLEASIYLKADKRKESYKDQWVAKVNGARAAGWMMTLYSFMGERRKAKIRQVLFEWMQNPKPSKIKVAKTWDPSMPLKYPRDERSKRVGHRVSGEGRLKGALRTLGISNEDAIRIGLKGGGY